MFLYFILLSAVRLCSCVLYDLTDAEYELMPPLFHLDEYEVCLKRDNGPYCLARFDLFADHTNELITLIKEYSKFTIKHYNHTYIERGVCVRTTCKNYINGTDKSKVQGLNTVLEACLNESVWNNYGLQAKLARVYYCDERKEGGKFDMGDWVFGGVLLTLFAINVIGSLHEVIYENEVTNNNFKKSANPYLLCFSLITNAKHFISTDVKSPSDERLKGLHGVRALLSFLMPIAHVMWLIGTGFTDNPRDFEKASESVHYQLIFNGMMLVQIFFVISSFLMTYTMQRFSETSPFTWWSLCQIFIIRWIRLTPMNALVITFTATWLRHLGSGPLWNHYVTGVVNDCRGYWWAHVLYINNYIPEDRACAVHSWHIATDTQLFLLGILLYTATRTSGERTKQIILSTLLLLSMVAPAVHVWLRELDALVLLKPEFYRSFTDETYRYVHVLGHNNIACFIIGMMTGHFSYSCQKKGINPLKHKIWRYLTWCILPAILVIILSGQIFYADADRASITIRMLYAALHRGVLGTIAAFLILGLVFKVENIQRNFLEWNGWMVISRLSYSAFLIHIDIVHVILGTRSQLAHVSFFYMIINHLGVVTLSYLIAIPFYLMVELPFARITKIWIEKKLKTSIKKEE